MGARKNLHLKTAAKFYIRAIKRKTSKTSPPLEKMIGQLRRAIECSELPTCRFSTSFFFWLETNNLNDMTDHCSVWYIAATDGLDSESMALIWKSCATKLFTCAFIQVNWWTLSNECIIAAWILNFYRYCSCLRRQRYLSKIIRFSKNLSNKSSCSNDFSAKRQFSSIIAH